MSTHSILEGRLDMLALPVECVCASLCAAQAREVADSFSERLSQLIAQRGEVSADVAAALARRPAC